jgi:hypothetical protein
LFSRGWQQRELDRLGAAAVDLQVEGVRPGVVPASRDRPERVGAPDVEMSAGAEGSGGEPEGLRGAAPVGLEVVHPVVDDEGDRVRAGVGQPCREGQLAAERQGRRVEDGALDVHVVGGRVAEQAQGARVGLLDERP